MGDQAFINLDILDVQRILIQVCGQQPRVTPQSDGSLLVEVALSKGTSQSLVSFARRYGFRHSSCKTHLMHRSCTVLRCQGIFGEERSIQEILDIVYVHKFQKKLDGAVTDTLSPTNLKQTGPRLGCGLCMIPTFGKIIRTKLMRVLARILSYGMYLFPV